MHNFFLHKNILIFRRFFNSANRFNNYFCMTITILIAYAEFNKNRKFPL